LSALPGPRPRSVFFGSPAFAVPSLERIVAATELVGVVTQPDRPSGRGQVLAEPAVKQAARRLAPGVPVLQPEKIRTGAFESQLRAIAGDLFIVVAYGRILPESILDLPRLGSWNVHASLLPRLRGAAPIQWSVINGAVETGVTIMRLDAGLDTGPIAAVAATNIGDDDTGGTLSERLAILGADLLLATLPRIMNGSVVTAPQNDADATLAPILAKEDGRLDFTQPARMVSARARGVDPWPGATALLEGQPVKLFGPRLGDGGAATTGDLVPGTVLAIDASGLCIACVDGPIVFAEVQMPGRKRLPASSVAAGRAITVGVRFG
jgi:methionyl-tRNA formyltransferase